MGGPDTRRAGGRAVTSTVVGSCARLLLGAVTGTGKGVFTKTPVAHRRHCRRRPVERIDFTVIHLLRIGFPPSHRRPLTVTQALDSDGVCGNDTPGLYFFDPRHCPKRLPARFGGGGVGVGGWVPIC